MDADQPHAPLSEEFRRQLAIESYINRIDFIFNRLDNVAMWVVGWMPKEDNQQHHNAVEHLKRVREELAHIRDHFERELAGERPAEVEP